MKERRKTTTSNFGVGARESHDSKPFYDRFRSPELSNDDAVAAPVALSDPFQRGDSSSMSAVADNSVALVVTSPPYFAGKQYEEELEREGVPASYLEYLEMLTAVFGECVRTLEPGGRIAVNVANLGRKPYRSLSADVIRILEHDLGLLLRGEIIWRKAEGASSSCAWGSFRSAANPVLRDVSERIIVASKGRFDRARTVKQRRAEGLPHENTVMTEDFMSLTLDVWDIAPESAKRVGHPAPFPVELPEQLIRLYTFKDDLVLDPFMGSGSTLVAASKLERRYVGYDLDPNYVEIARARVAAEGAPSSGTSHTRSDAVLREGKAAKAVAEEALVDAGFEIIATNRKVPKTGAVVSFVAKDPSGSVWYFDVPGSLSAYRGGLQRTEAVWRALGKAASLQPALVSEEGRAIPFVLLAGSLPGRSSQGDMALRSAGTTHLFDVIDLLSQPALDRLAEYATAGGAAEPLPGFWAERDLNSSRH